MDRKPERKPTGRPVSDDRGNSTWEWSVDGELDTARLKALTEGLAVDAGTPEETQPKSAGLDPYNKQLGSAVPRVPTPEPESKRRTLDDMRRLSDEIKRKRKDQQG
jgi:hypothetical protein